MARAHANHRGFSTVVMNLTGDDRETVRYLAELGAEGVEFLLAEDSDIPPQDLPLAFSSSDTPVYARFVASGTDLTDSHKIPWKLVALRMQPPPGTIPLFTDKLRNSTGLDPDDPANHPALLTTYRPEISKAMTAAASQVGYKGYGKSLTNWSCISIFGSSPKPVGHHSVPIATASNFKMVCDHGWLHTVRLVSSWSGTGWQDRYRPVYPGSMTLYTPAPRGGLIWTCLLLRVVGRYQSGPPR